MATTDPDKTGRTPISAATRKRLQMAFEHANKVSSQGNFDYATELFTTCVTSDPANKFYIQNFLANLQKKYNNNKKGSKLGAITGAGSRAQLQKSVMQKDWKGVLDAGVKLLKLNPWDTAALTALATAAAAQENDDAQLVYLKAALDTNLRDTELNRLYGRALANTGEFDQALVAWQRVKQAVPEDDEAGRAIHNLTVEKTIKDSGFEQAESTREVQAPIGLPVDPQEFEVGVLTPERQLQRAIDRNPADPQNYVKLYELHYGKENLDEAEKWLTKAVEVSGGSLMLREQLEDLKLKRQRDHLHTAKRQAEAERTPATIELYKKLAADLVRTELEIYRSRAERYPTNLTFHYELGLRLQKIGNYPEAIKEFQLARGDVNRRGLVCLALGECFYRIKQFPLAMNNFEAAVREIAEERDPEPKKLALYYAGSLAMAQKDWDKADKFLTDLAGIDFGFKDVSERLDKVAQERHKR